MKLPTIKRLLCNAFLLAALALGATDASAELVVVVSSKSAISSLTAAQVARIFLGKTGSYPGGGNAVPLDQAEGSEIRNEFYLRVTGKSASQLRAYWAKIIFAGDGQPPRILQNSEEVKQELSRNPDAIGYIDRSALNGNFRVVLTP